MSKKLSDYGKTATMVLSNSHAIQIAVNESGDGVYYKYSDSDEIKEAEIEYLEDTEDVTGYADTEDGLFQPAFTTDTGRIYFLGTFIRDEYGKF